MVFGFACLVLVAQEGETSWTEADSRLANQYLTILQKQPEYGQVLDLLWALYEGKGQTDLLLGYISQAAQADGADVPRLIHAHLLRKAGQLNEARREYDRVVSALPDSVPALLAMAEISVRQQRTAKALSYYRRLTRLVPVEAENGADIRFRMADLLRDRGQRDEAVRLWQQVLESGETIDVSTRERIVQLMLESGATDEALDILEAQVDDSTAAAADRVAALGELMRVYEWLGDFPGAESTARRAMESLHYRHHQHSQIFERLVRLHERFGKLERLEERLNGAVLVTNPTEASLYLLAEYYRLTANAHGEATALEGLVQRVAGDVDYRIRLAEALMRCDRAGEAAVVLDHIFADTDRPALHLVLLRAEIDLREGEQEAAEQRLSLYLESHPDDADAREEITEFAQEHYMDQLVETLLRRSSDRSGDKDAEAPIQLARFLKDRGQDAQARDVLAKYVAEAGETQTERSRRLHSAAIAYREIGLLEDAHRTIQNALELSPESIVYLDVLASILVDQDETDEAVAVLEQVWDLHEEIASKTDVDQKIFSLLRSSAEASSYKKPMPEQAIDSIYNYRRAAAMASRTAYREADEAPPQVLLDYFEKLRRTANRSREVADRYRAGWWAFKLQKNNECLFQLQAVEMDTGQIVLEVEELLLEYAMQNEKNSAMAKHLESLAVADPENADDYWRRWAEAKFKTGFEDIAVRKLKQLAAKPDASLQTLNSLAKVYAEQGNAQKQVEVWRVAYRKANLVERRRYIRHLTSALVEQQRIPEALAELAGGIEKESDQIQRRKLFEQQLTIASQHHHLPSLRDSYLKARRSRPFDRFYTEALGQVYVAMDSYREAFDTLKEAYYLSDRGDTTLLVQLGELANQVGDIDAAIYYTKQRLDRPDTAAGIDEWQELIGLLEQDLRLSEAAGLRRSLENRFAQDPGALGELGHYYWQQFYLGDAQRLFSAQVGLQPWSAQAQFDLALVTLELGDRELALQHFLRAIAESREVPVPSWASDGELWPIVQSSRDSQRVIDRLYYEVQTFPMLSDEAETALMEWTQQRRHLEFAYRPTADYAVRLRAIEEAARLGYRLEQGTDREQMWSAYYGGDLDLLKQAVAGDWVSQFALAQAQAGVGKLVDRVEWAAFAYYLVLKHADGVPDGVAEQLAEMESLASLTQKYIFDQLVKKRRFGEVLQLAEAMQVQGDFAYLVSHVAGWMGEREAQSKWLAVAAASIGPLQYGGALSALDQLAVLDSLRSGIGVAIPESRTELTDLQYGILRQLSAGDWPEGGFAPLAAALLQLEPRVYGDEVRLPASHFGVERVAKEMQFYIDLLPLSVRREHDLFEGFDGIESSDSLRMTRLIESYHAMPLADREASVRERYREWGTEGSQVEFADRLGDYGYHYHAAQVYRWLMVWSQRAEPADFAWYREAFRASEQSMDTKRLAGILSNLDTGHLEKPTGLTDAMLAQQRARFFRLNRDIEMLLYYSQPVDSGSHRPFQSELLRTYLEQGQSEAAMRLLESMRLREETERSDDLVGAELFLASGDAEQALEWLDLIPLDHSQPDVEAAALRGYIAIAAERGTEAEYKWLVERVLDRGDFAMLTRYFAVLVERDQDSLADQMLQRYVQLEPADSDARLMYIDRLRAGGRRIAREVQAYLSGLTDYRYRAPKFAEWLHRHPEVHPVVLPTLQKHPHWFARLCADYIEQRLDLTADYPDEALLCLAEWGDVGQAVVRDLLGDRVGPDILPGQVALQLKLFHTIRDTERLEQCHATLMDMAGHMSFYSQSLQPGYASITSLWGAPELLAELGYDELADSLYRRFFSQIRQHRSDLVPFVASYFDRLVAKGDLETARSVYRDICHYDLGFDVTRVLDFEGIESLDDYGLTPAEKLQIEERFALRKQ